MGKVNQFSEEESWVSNYNNYEKFEKIKKKKPDNWKKKTDNKKFKKPKHNENF